MEFYQNKIALLILAKTFRVVENYSLSGFTTDFHHQTFKKNLSRTWSYPTCLRGSLENKAFCVSSFANFEQLWSVFDKVWLFKVFRQHFPKKKILRWSFKAGSSFFQPVAPFRGSVCLQILFCHKFCQQASIITFLFHWVAKIIPMSFIFTDIKINL